MPSRELIDSDGTVWEVFEVRRKPDPAAVERRSVSRGLEAGWLTFASKSEKRRMPEFPSGWETLSDEELWSLFHKARRAPQPDLRFAGRNVAVSGTATGSSERIGSVEPPDVRSDVEPGAGSIERMVRTHARSARGKGTPPVEALVQLKRMLTDAGHATDKLSLKRARGWFVESYYLERRKTPRE
ncbi:MAG: hypothetical protein ABIP93_18485 [Gemmatimonadaceae bacterium]